MAASQYEAFQESRPFKHNPGLLLKLTSNPTNQQLGHLSRSSVSSFLPPSRAKGMNGGTEVPQNGLRTNSVRRLNFFMTTSYERAHPSYRMRMRTANVDAEYVEKPLWNPSILERISMNGQKGSDVLIILLCFKLSVRQVVISRKRRLCQLRLPHWRFFFRIAHIVLSSGDIFFLNQFQNFLYRKFRGVELSPQLGSIEQIHKG